MKMIGISHSLVAEIWQERLYQDEQWGGHENDDQRLPAEWLALITEQSVRGRVALLTRSETHYRERLVKIAALAVAAIESYDRNADKGAK